MIVYAVTVGTDRLLHLCLDEKEAIDYASPLNTVTKVTKWNLVEQTQEIVYRKLITKKGGYVES